MVRVDCWGVGEASVRCVKSVVNERNIARRKNKDEDDDDDDESVGKRDKYTIIIISCSIQKIGEET